MESRTDIPQTPSGATEDIDLERVICRLEGLAAGGARGFAIGDGPWPLRGFVVRSGSEIRAFVNRCPHRGHPLNLSANRFLTADESLILCASHGALFEKLTGYCVAGPCVGLSLRPLAVRIVDGFVLLGDEVDPAQMQD